MLFLKKYAPLMELEDPDNLHEGGKNAAVSGFYHLSRQSVEKKGLARKR